VTGKNDAQNLATNERPLVVGERCESRKGKGYSMTLFEFSYSSATPADEFENRKE
jgi:hypothetical protein